MLDTFFHIILHIKTVKGFEKFGKFYIGNDKLFAESLFNKLIGKTDIDEKTILYLEMMESRRGLPQELHVLGCTLEQLSENCSIITKETFKHFNLEEIK